MTKVFVEPQNCAVLNTFLMFSSKITHVPFKSISNISILELECIFSLRTDLCSSRNVVVLEKIAIFMHFFGHRYTNKEIQERFEHSGDTISWSFQQILKASLFIHVEWVSLPQIPNIIPDYITSNPKFTPYCVDSLALWMEFIYLHIYPLKAVDLIKIGVDVWYKIFLSLATLRYIFVTYYQDEKCLLMILEFLGMQLIERNLWFLLENTTIYFFLKSNTETIIGE